MVFLLLFLSTVSVFWTLKHKCKTLLQSAFDPGWCELCHHSPLSARPWKHTWQCHHRILAMPSAPLGDVRHNKHKTWQLDSSEICVLQCASVTQALQPGTPRALAVSQRHFFPWLYLTHPGWYIMFIFLTGCDVKKVVTSSLGEDPGLREPGWPFNWVLIFLLPLPTQSPSPGTVRQVLEHLSWILHPPYPFFMAVMVVTGGWIPSPFTWNMHTLQLQIYLFIK